MTAGGWAPERRRRLGWGILDCSALSSTLRTQQSRWQIVEAHLVVATWFMDPSTWNPAQSSKASQNQSVGPRRTPQEREREGGGALPLAAVSACPPPLWPLPPLAAVFACPRRSGPRRTPREKEREGLHRSPPSPVAHAALALEIGRAHV